MEKSEMEKEPASKSKKKLRFSIDRGGTFTDIYCEIIDPSSPSKVDVKVMKLLSEDPEHYKDAPTEAIRRFLVSETGCSSDINSRDLDISQIESIRMGTTVATNALLERKGKDVVLVTTRGFKDVLEIGNQSRPDIFDLKCSKPELLYKHVIEVDERVVITEGDLLIEKEPDLVVLEKQLKEVKSKGIESVAVVFMHSYAFPEHERVVSELCEKLGFAQVSASHAILPMIRIVPRGYTTLVDAYLSPILNEYLTTFSSGFANNLEGVDVKFMQSDGGLTAAHTFMGSRSIFSGPAGGVVGYSRSSFEKRPLIGFDMGGTSTDVSRYNGVLEHIYDCEIAGVKMQVPQLDITTVAAGGGSRLFFKNGSFVVGPESAGAHPGPVCYAKGGHLAITDANLILGRIIPEHFPKIFGPTEDQPLDYEATKKAFEELTKEINEYRKDTKQMTIEEVAQGFISVADECMCRPIRNITAAKGFDTRKHDLVCFGGAAPQHGCSVARILGISKVKIHKYTGILSAVGLSMADTVEEAQEPSGMEYCEGNFSAMEQGLKRLEQGALNHENIKGKFKKIQILKYLNMRYDKTDYSMMVHVRGESSNIHDYQKEFEKRYFTEYGFILRGRKIIVDDVRVRVIGKTETFENITMKQEVSGPPKEVKKHKMYVDGKWKDVSVYDLHELSSGSIVKGPCIVLQNTSTVVVLPDCELKVTDNGSIEIELHTSGKRKDHSLEVDPILLSIFSNRFMSIAEEMGRTLQRTSISTNIKERLDFSCAIFGPSGNLVANAPHLPVHLGSMSEAVRFQISHLGDTWKEGEVIMANHPKAGGTHLPDITVITPVWAEKDGEKRPVFYVAARGHHADIGGLTAGSMPPFSKTLKDEGVAVVSFKIVEDSKFQVESLKDVMKESRCVEDNIADLKAQIAANNKGIQLFHSLIEEYGLKVVHAYMKHIQDNACEAVKNMLGSFRKKNPDPVTAVEFMDDGSKIKLTVSIDENSNEALFDFSGTSPQVYGNWNAPRAVTTSAILYCMRCLIKNPIPLNHGVLRAIRSVVPKECLLNPGIDCAVVGGNVETSQRITDVIFKAFAAVAASQGTMNNFCFGSSNFGYYETICGGAGAGSDFQGTSGVHTHMTNTRITDAEILESRYPVVLREFSIRKGSGGVGEFKGGDGVIRKFQFLKDLQVSILSERRTFAPYGMKGGASGKRGKNLWITKNEKGESVVFSLGGKNAVKVKKNDLIVILTPGGGGFGKPIVIN